MLAVPVPTEPLRNELSSVVEWVTAICCHAVVTVNASSRSAAVCARTGSPPTLPITAPEKKSDGPLESDTIPKRIAADTAEGLAQAEIDMADEADKTAESTLK